VTDCNGCGQCCSPVVLPYSRHEAQMLLPAVRHEMFTEREWRWIMEDLEPIPRRDGLADVGQPVAAPTRKTVTPRP